MATAGLPATVSRIVAEAGDAHLLRLELPEGSRFSWLPGQFIEVELPGSGLPARAYSIANPPTDPDGDLEILLDRHGAVSERLLALRGGETLLVRGPLGKWHYRDEDKRAALVSTGTGLAPLRAMIRYALEKGLPNRLALFYADRTPGRLLFRRELQGFAERGVGVHVSVTEPEGLWEEGQWWDGPRGPITVETLRAGLGSLDGVAFYLCGGGRLIDALRAGLTAAGAPADAFRVEKWGDY